jgi:hypothetical protein
VSQYGRSLQTVLLFCFEPDAVHVFLQCESIFGFLVFGVLANGASCAPELVLFRNQAFDVVCGYANTLLKNLLYTHTDGIAVDLTKP